MHMETEDKCETQEEVGAEALAEEGAVTEVEVEVAVTEDIAVPEPVTRASEKTVGDAVSGGQVSAEAEPPLGKVVTETVAESVVEVVTDVPENERVTEAAVSPATPAAEDGKEVLAEENAPEVPAETAIKTEVTPDENTFFFSLFVFLVFTRIHRLFHILQPSSAYIACGLNINDSFVISRTNDHKGKVFFFQNLIAKTKDTLCPVFVLVCLHQQAPVNSVEAAAVSIFPSLLIKK